MIDNHKQNKEVGELIDQYRLSIGLKQKDLAQKAGIDPSMISRLKHGRFNATLSVLQKITTVLELGGISEDEIDRLWKTAGYQRTTLFNQPISSKVVLSIQQELASIQDAESKVWLEDELQELTNLNRVRLTAKKHMKGRKWKVARQELVALQEAMDKKAHKWTLRVDEDLGTCFFSEGRYDEAIRAYESAWWRARRVGDRRKEADILIRLGSALRRKGGGSWDEAQLRYEEALAIYEGLDQEDMVSICLRKIGSSYLFRGQPNKGLPLVEKSLAQCRQRNDVQGIYKGLQHQGWAYNLLGRWEEATQLRKEALGLVKDTSKDEWEIAKAYWYLGDAYRLERRREEARLSYEKAQQIMQKYEEHGKGAQLIMGMILLGLGKVYIKLPGQELKAKALLNESLIIYRDLREDFKIAEVLNEQGDLLLKLGQYDEAEMRLEQAHRRLKTAGNDFQYANVLVSLGELHYQRQRFHKIEGLLTIARNLKDGELLNYPLAKLELLAGKSFAANQSYNKAIESFCQASSSALAFNAQTFVEIRDEIIAFSYQMPLDETARFFEQYLNYLILMQEHVSTTDKALFQRSQKLVEKKQSEMRALMPIA